MVQISGRTSGRHSSYFSICIADLMFSRVKAWARVRKLSERGCMHLPAAFGRGSYDSVRSARLLATLGMTARCPITSGARLTQLLSSNASGQSRVAKSLRPKASRTGGISDPNSSAREVKPQSKALASREVPGYLDMAWAKGLQICNPCPQGGHRTDV